MKKWQEFAIKLREKNARTSYRDMVKTINKKFKLTLTADDVRKFIREEYKGFNKNKNNNKTKRCVGVKEGKKEIKPIVKDNGDFYLIMFNKRKITVTKEKLRELKILYCENKLTINQICRRMEIPRRDFILIKTAFNITHDDVPYIDEDIINADPEKLAAKTLERQKDRYFIKLQEQEITEMKQELAMFRKKDYFYDKVIKQVSIPIAPMNFNIIKIDSNVEAQLNFADWHTGLKVENFWNKYSLEIQRQYLEKLVSKTLYFCKRHNVKKIHVLNLGDLLHGNIHTSTRIVAEVDVIQQLRITWQLISDILQTFAKNFEEVYFYSTYGNHSRVTENKTDALDRENFELLIPDFLSSNLQNFKNITIMKNQIDDQILVAKPNGHLIYGVHGDRDKNEKVAQNLTMMLEKKPYKIFTSHTHHKEVLEVHKVDVIVSRALCGVDDYSKGIRATAKAGQSLYIYTPECLECTYDITFN